MKHKVYELLPVGIRPSDELKPLIISITGSVLFSMSFLISYINNTNNAKNTHVNSTYELVKIDSFIDLYHYCMVGFLIVTACMPILILFHYLYHYYGSKSIYLMKRLPNRSELFRRCFFIPVSGMILCLFLVILLTLLYYAVYVYATPKELLPVGSDRQLLLLLKKLIPFNNI